MAPIGSGLGENGPLALESPSFTRNGRCLVEEQGTASFSQLRLQVLGADFPGAQRKWRGAIEHVGCRAQAEPAPAARG